ncbi:MAG: peptidylprolyl isomerase [Pontiellaceae bacterium]|nr:peptidylprolyl isomerase [Pontiellaceae bacterium]MBN2783903.1 peptidylprolyl isomerase [Pontiellaceae bacterium]
MFENLLNKSALLALPAAAVIVLAGCKENEAIASAPEQVDLTQTKDMFTAPVQANPLANDPEAVVVRVNGEDITYGEIMETLGMAMQQFAGQVPPEQLQQFQAQFFNQIKDDLITKKLLKAAVNAAGIEVDPAKITETIEKIRTQIPEGQTLESILESRGETMDSLKKELSGELATQELLDSETANIADASEEDAKKFYDENPDQFVQQESASASHILIKFDDEDTDEAKAEKKAELQKIRDEIIAGTISFEDAATENSDCPSSAQGGSLGTFGKGRMVPEFETAAFSQEIGEVGPIIETQFGYHIVKVTDRTDEGSIDFEKIKDKLIEYLTSQNKQKAVAEYLESLRAGADIQEM